MTRFFVFGLLGLFVTLSASAQDEIDCQDLEDRDGVLYQDNEPFKGVCYIYHASGKPASQTTYNRGLPNGEQTNWYENGNVMEIVHYVDFYRHGYARFFYENGFLKKEGNYNNCIEDGRWTYYYPNGKVEHIEYWTDGKESGTWQYFDQEGRLVKTEEKD